MGAAEARLFAREGAMVAIGDVLEEEGRRVAAQIGEAGGKAIFLALDVTSESQWQDAIAATVAEFGKLDILVNDAGVVGAAGWWERETPNDDDWDHVLAVNLRGVVNVSEAVAPHMKERRYGKIVNIASIAGRQGGPDIPHYNASKTAVISWTQSNALQLATYNINVNAICPGLLWTPMFEGLVRRRSAFTSDESLQGVTGREHFEKLIEATIPMKREQTPEDIGKLAAFLASDDAHNITGQAINVDGGRRMD